MALPAETAQVKLGGTHYALHLEKKDQNCIGPLREFMTEQIHKVVVADIVQVTFTLTALRENRGYSY